MIVIAGLILGAAVGATRARKARGNRLDMLQYAAAHGIAFAVLGMFLTIVIDRMV